tara:strand:- start:94 stop:408 length:315 start_codon:yes stop_codon:yes gene_type:complete
LASKPYQNTRLAAFVTKRVLELKHKKTQAQIADQTGFSSVNMISMLKSDASKLPHDHVPALAVECHPAFPFRMALEQLDCPTTASGTASTSWLPAAQGIGHLGG